MRDVWVLSVRTSLPKVCLSAYDLELSVYAFDSFEKARDAARRIIKSYAFSRNKMFGGKGKLTNLEEFKEEMQSEADNPRLRKKPKYLSREKMERVTDALLSVFRGEDCVPELAEGDCSDECYVGYRFEDGALRMYSEDDGGFGTDYDPILETNMFSMQAEGDYYLHIDPRFGQDEPTPELYIDLVKADVFDK